MASPRILSTVLALLSLLLLLVALGSDHWLVAGSLHEGLWKSCLNSLCGQISSASGEGSPAPPGNPPGLRAVPFAPGLCAMIALAVYTGEFAGAVNAAQGQVTFGWSFGLGWASFPLFLITGECNIGEARDRTEESSLPALAPLTSRPHSPTGAGWGHSQRTWSRTAVRVKTPTTAGYVTMQTSSLPSSPGAGVKLSSELYEMLPFIRASETFLAV
uniref:Uncharacterized protein n=1 Tax=Gopherus agassizii TaxID=38772 RepID=A0A452HWP2_9SAUR